MWQLPLSVAKCSLLNVGHVPVTANYHFAGSLLTKVEYCRNLGDTVTVCSSTSHHIGEITLKPHQHANYIIKSLISDDETLLMRAFIVFCALFLSTILIFGVVGVFKNDYSY